MLKRLRARWSRGQVPEVPSAVRSAEDGQFPQLHPEQWGEAGQRMGLRNLTHRRTTTQWRGD